MKLKTNSLGLKLQAICAGLARSRLSDFLRYGWDVLDPGTPLEWNWHIETVCDHVQGMLDDWLAHRKDPTFTQRAINLLMNVPPGTLKSRILNVYAPAWMWLHAPDWSVLCLSINPENVLRDARLSRDLIESKWYQTWFKPQWKISKKQNAAGSYANTMRGSRHSKGITAKVTGQRAHAIFVDDPNDAEDINSSAHRDGVNNRWSSTIYNRVNDRRTSIRIGIMQRLHEDDWSGYVLRTGQWAHLCLPMEFDPDIRCTTPFGFIDPRKVEGEVLHPERFTPEVLAADMIALGPYGYAGQMQQRPAPKGGGKFKRDNFEVIDRLPDGRFKKSRGWDFASTEGGGDGSASVLTYEHVETGDIIIVDSWWLQVGPGKLRAHIDFTVHDDDPDVFQSFPKDPAAAGVYQVADLVKILDGIPHEFTPESGDKEARATPFASQVETRTMIGRKVKLLRGHWNKHYLDLMCAFPKGRYKDTTDAQSRSYGALITRKEASPVSVRGGVQPRVPGSASSEHSSPWG